MRVRTLGYPDSVAIPAYNDGSDFFRIEFPNIPSRSFRFSSVNVDTDASMDNVIIRWLDGEVTAYTVYLQNQIDGVSDSTAGFSGPSTITIGGTTSPSNGNFDFIIEIETGVGTEEFVPLTLDQTDFSFSPSGTPFMEALDYGDSGSTCFWTELVKVSQECDNTPPGPSLFSATGDNNVTYVQITNCVIPTDDNGATGPVCFDLGASTYNAFVYFNLNNAGSGFFATYGAQPDGYTGAITDVELQQLDKNTLDVLDTTPLADVPISVIDYFNGNMFGGFGGPITGFPVLTDDSYWRLVGQLDLTDGVTTGDPVSGAVSMPCSQGPGEVFGMDFVEGGQAPSPFPFYEFEGGEIGDTEADNSVTFADTGSYSCDALGPADFTVDDVPYTEPDFVNSCS